MLQSPLRQPSGKARILRNIPRYFPLGFTEYREIWAGSAMLLLYVRQQFPHVRCWLNDPNPEVVLFWRAVQQSNILFCAELEHIRQHSQTGEQVFNETIQLDPTCLTDLEQAVRFFLLNRLSIGGQSERGYSRRSLRTRFTLATIEYIRSLEAVLAGVQITNRQYAEVVNHAGDDVFMFLQTPEAFDHQTGAAMLKSNPQHWLILAEDTPDLHHVYDFANVHTGWMQEELKHSHPMLITNYALPYQLDLSAGL